MLQGLLRALLFSLGKGLIHLGYGKKAMQARKDMEANGTDALLAVLFSLGIIGWMVCLILWVSGAAAKDTLVCIIITLAFPALYVIWCVFARKRGKYYIQEADKLEKERLEKARLEREQREKEYLEKLRLEREEQKRLEEEKKEQLRQLLSQKSNGTAGMSEFAIEIENLNRVKDIAMLWESLRIEDSDLAKEITRKIEAAAKAERTFGSNLKSLKVLVEEIQKLILGEKANQA